MGKNILKLVAPFIIAPLLIVIGIKLYTWYTLIAVNWVGLTDKGDIGMFAFTSCFLVLIGLLLVSSSLIPDEE